MDKYLINLLDLHRMGCMKVLVLSSAALFTVSMVVGALLGAYVAERKCLCSKEDALTGTCCWEDKSADKCSEKCICKKASLHSEQSTEFCRPKLYDMKETSSILTMTATFLAAVGLFGLFFCAVVWCCCTEDRVTVVLKHKVDQPHVMYGAQPHYPVIVR